MLGLSMKNKILIFFLITIQHISLHSQSKEISVFLTHIRNYDFKSAKNIAKELENPSLTDKLIFYTHISKNMGINSSTKQINSFVAIKTEYVNYLQIFNYLNKGLYNFYYKTNTDSKVLENYLKALDISKKIKDKFLLREIYLRILEYYNNIFLIKDTSYKIYLDEYKKIAKDSVDRAIIDFYTISIEIKNSNTNILKSQFLIAQKIEKEIKIPFYASRLKILIGNYYEENKELKEALSYYIEALSLYKSPKDGYEIISYLGATLNIGVYYYFNKNYKKSLLFLKNIEKNNGKLIKRKRIYFDYWLALVYAKLEKHKEAFFYLKRSRTNQFSFNQSKHLVAINDIQTKYQTAKKEKENLQLKQINQQTEIQRKQNKNLFLGALLFILFAGTTAVLSLKNSKKKRILAQQAQEISTQKNLTLLKEQELTTINALIEGQEKERKRIAEDLHDNIGSVLATLKLHFDNLQINREKKKFNQDELFQKTEKLIDEAYFKVRSIAHAKNAGVIANQGLLVGIQMMAEKITSANTIKIDVIHFGLSKRIENSLEIGVFRIIQELITNILKHAEAKNTTINISQYENTLHIIVEDDGKGFDYKKTEFKNGMGLNSIKTRIVHLKGTFNIDSTIGKGTSILINIPIT